MTQDAQKFGAALRVARKRYGLSQADLALSVGTSVTSVRNWERGTNLPYASKLRPIANALQVDPSVLLERGEFVSISETDPTLADRVAMLEEQMRQVIAALPSLATGPVPGPVESLLQAGALAPAGGSAPNRDGTRA